MDIVIAGVGGLGGYYGGRLAAAYSGAGEHKVKFFCRGAHLEAIREKGLEVRAADGTFTARPALATVRADELSACDLLLVCVDRGDRVAVLVSGLGATPLMEQYILYASVAKYLETAGLTVAVPLVGNFFTSLEMMGVTLTLLQLDDELERLMKHPCASIGLKLQGAQR